MKKSMFRRFMTEMGEAIHRVAIGYDDSEQQQPQPPVEKSQQELHHELCHLVKKLGKSFGKRHGSWILLTLENDMHIVMDSWSDALTIGRGPLQFHRTAAIDSPEFRDKSMPTDPSVQLSGIAMHDTEYLGMDFGGFSPRASTERLHSLIHQVFNLHAQELSVDSKGNTGLTPSL